MKAAAGLSAIVILLGTSPAHAVAPSDLLTAKLEADKLDEPDADITWVRAQVDRLTDAARGIAGPNADEPAKLRAVRTVIYEPGSWNDNKPLSYDLTDPEGLVSSRNATLWDYLKTRHGNCISMPVLFLILADRLGLHAELVRAPKHYFVRYYAPDGRRMNIETTSGGYPARDAYYQETSNITEAALKGGFYLGDLTRAQTLAEIKKVEFGAFLRDHHYDQALALADELVVADARNAEAHIMRAAVYGTAIGEKFARRWLAPNLIPAELRGEYLGLVAQAKREEDEAIALGWSDAVHRSSTAKPSVSEKQ